ncbi:ORF38 [Bovine gammaherpesvirus 6]|uniref:Cytoplasmic envelopment protein 3 n=1 Tax=Bovine gammaherpesvirus 6 TaxID=1504288 RepID=A0A060CU19_9GAMA|nr:ORF38 [Bovine gammaherpesvirus 6]AIB03192.1 ORF38 [Bovine gammaherpesvirus 6]
MGSCFSRCFRRRHSIMDVEGNHINVEEEFDEFNESDDLLVEVRHIAKARPPTPYTDDAVIVKQ